LSAVPSLLRFGISTAKVLADKLSPDPATLPLVFIDITESPPIPECDEQ
jgi:hypothetical protein